MGVAFGNCEVVGSTVWQIDAQGKKKESLWKMERKKGTPDTGGKNNP